MKLYTRISHGKYQYEKQFSFLFISGVRIYIATMMQIVMDGRNVMQEFVKENTLKFSGENKII